MKYAPVLLLLLLSVHAYDVSLFYCGFGGDYCGQSTDDDVNHSVRNVILAFVNTNPDGSVTVDDVDFPTDLVKAWQDNGKRVVVSVGGQNGNWNYVFASADSINNFVNSLVQVVDYYGLDGVDLDIESYAAAPRTVANAIIQLKAALGSRIIIVSPEDVAVYQGTSVPSADVGGQAFNYFVPIIELADKAIDFYQPQAYNNWYEEAAGTLKYLQNVYLNWRNFKGTGQWDVPIPNFSGVAGEKLLLGVLASPSAGGPGYYYTPDVITQFKNWIAANKDNGYALQGFMMWDSHWDALNSYLISTVCAA